MASSHRVTDLENIPVRISKDEAPTPLSVVGPLFISSLLFHLSRTFTTGDQRACLLMGVLFYFPNLSLFVSSYVKIKKFCSF